ncbi:MFS transporter [Flavihumibacter rivuli]|uniref:MFS transporter n=1 Tax=Flavihumibacter rivuli TaxID=2838156 RepID=UPI001BDEBE1F|nr:MFS transporter [Flavihumibacter rivuli]ULQ55808.1 MFS transporter [Flavihumibacter rivuli]
MKSGQIRITHIGLFITCFLSSVVGGTVSTLMSVYLPVAIRELLGPENLGNLDQISAYVNAIFILGWALGGFTWGLIGDRIGRKKALLLAIGSYGLATIATGSMQLWEGLVICRFISGFGVGGTLVLSFTLLSEVWPAKSRSIFIGILSIGIPTGIFSAGLINYLVTSWRQGFLVGIIPVAISLIAWIWLKIPTVPIETTTSKETEATAFSGVHGRNLIKGSVIFGSMLIGLWAIFSWLPTWIQSISPGHDAHQERGMSMMLLGFGGLTGGFLSGWIANALGLRRCMLLCFTACTALTLILLLTNSQVRPVLYLEIGVLAFFFGISQGVLSAYIPQLFPSVIRGTATGFCFNIGRILTAIGVMFVGLLVSSLGGYGNTLTLFTLSFVIGAMALLLDRSQTESYSLLKTK